MSKQKIIVILGQTATGKSDLAVRLAKKVNGEIISADSRQVYKGLDIGTGKITKKEMGGITHYLLDVASPKSVFSAANYKTHAEQAIRTILAKGKTPIICGGTGFYISAIADGIVFPEVPPNKKLRADLENKDLPYLFKMLKKLDAKRARNIDIKNKVRLIRAIEIAQALGTVPKLKKQKTNYKFVKIGLFLPLEELRQKIHLRLIKRIKSGMVKEAKRLHQEKLSFKRMHELGLEYRYLSLYLDKKISKDEMIKQLDHEILNYAKRQMTWFKRDKNIFWFNANQISIKKILSLIEKD